MAYQKSAFFILCIFCCTIWIWNPFLEVEPINTFFLFFFCFIGLFVLLGSVRLDYFRLRCVHMVVLLYDVVLVQKYVYDLLLHRTRTFCMMLKKICPNGRTQHIISVVYKNQCLSDFFMKGWIFVQNIAFLFYIPTLVFLCDCFFSFVFQILCANIKCLRKKTYSTRYLFNKLKEIFFT